LVPQISVQTIRGQIAAETEPAKLEIRRPQPVVQAKTTPAKITATNRPGVLIADQTLTNNALTGGKPEAFWKRIYSQYQDIYMQNLLRIVEEGNIMGDLRKPGNPIPDLALNDFIEGPPDLQVFGPASPDNIEFEYIPNDINLQVEVGGVEIKVQTFRPEIRAEPGKVHIYMKQYPQVIITPPVIDITI